MFRLVNNVPDTYVSQSRDFQLLCALFDLVQNSTKHQIDTIVQTLNTAMCPDVLIPLLRTKLGFFVKDSSYYTVDALRLILSVFLDVCRYKGSRLGIQYAANTFVKLLRIDENCRITINSIDGDKDKYKVILRCNSPMRDTRILDDILNYIMPSGYIVIYQQVHQDPRKESIITVSHDVSFINEKSSEVVQQPNTDTDDEYKDQDPSKQYTRRQLFNIGGVGTAVIANTVEQKEEQ